MTKLVLAVVFLITSLLGCAYDSDPQSASGVKRVAAQVQVGADGMTVEQRNVRDRLQQDNIPGSIKHLYVISPWTGDVLIYSTVRGKVTSSGKRLTPTRIEDYGRVAGSVQAGITVDVAGTTMWTKELIQDDGTYGSSNPYIYWFDSQGRYHQHFFTGGQIIHISDQPIAVPSVVLNLEEVSSSDQQPVDP